MRAFLLTTAALFLGAALAHGQAIETGELSSAQAYEPGTLAVGDGALSNNLWAGTTASTAMTLMSRLPLTYKHEISRDLVRAALLSPGVPPRDDNGGQFAQARLDAVIGLSEMAAAQDIAKRTPGLSSSRELQADLALLAGNVPAACGLSDSIMAERSEAYWMKLRAFCHVERGETAAAELTLDLIKSSGHSDRGFETLMRQLIGIPGKPDLKAVSQSPLSIAMMSKAALDWPAGQRPAVAAARQAFNPVVSPDERLTALFGAAHALSNAQISQVLGDIGRVDNSDTDDLAGAAAIITAQPTLQSAQDDKTARGFAQLFALAQQGAQDEQMGALIALLARAERAGALARFVTYFDQQLSSLSYFDLRREDMPLIIRAAILRGDLGGLQQIHSLLNDNTNAQDRLALAADALGNGFYAGSLGVDIDSRLKTAGSRNRALRDALLAHALGANFSNAALDILAEKPNMGRLSGELLALSAAARNRAQAETALRAAFLLEETQADKLNDLTLYAVVDALYRAGLNSHAAKIAARDFTSDFPE